MKVRELVKKFDELLSRHEKITAERDDLRKKLAELASGAGRERESTPQSAEQPPDWKKTEEELLGKIKVLEKNKAGLQDKCIALDKEKKAAQDKLKEIESKMQGDMQTLMNITRENAGN